MGIKGVIKTLRAEAGGDWLIPKASSSAGKDQDYLKKIVRN